MNSRLWPTEKGLAIWLLLCAAGAFAQGGGRIATPGPNQPLGPQIYVSQGSILQLTVVDENRHPLDRQCVVKLVNKATQAGIWQTTQDRSQASFGDLEVGHYDIEVSAVGYLTAHKDLNVASALFTYQEEIILKRDPAAVELSAPNESQMPSKARKAIQRGVTALKSGNMKAAQKELEAAYRLVPTSPDVNFLQGYLYFQQKNFEQAQTYLKSAVKLDTHNVQALMLLAHISLQHEDYGSARTWLEQAVAASPKYWMAHKLLAETCLKQHEYENAREQAQLAIQENEGGSNGAQFVLAESLANLGRD